MIVFKRPKNVLEDFKEKGGKKKEQKEWKQTFNILKPESLVQHSEGKKNATRLEKNKGMRKKKEFKSQVLLEVLNLEEKGKVETREIRIEGSLRKSLQEKLGYSK